MKRTLPERWEAKHIDFFGKPGITWKVWETRDSLTPSTDRTFGESRTLQAEDIFSNYLHERYGTAFAKKVLGTLSRKANSRKNPSGALRLDDSMKSVGNLSLSVSGSRSKLAIPKSVIFKVTKIRPGGYYRLTVKDWRKYTLPTFDIEGSMLAKHFVLSSSFGDVPLIAHGNTVMWKD